MRIAWIYLHVVYFVFFFPRTGKLFNSNTVPCLYDAHHHPHPLPGEIFHMKSPPINFNIWRNFSNATWVIRHTPPTDQSPPESGHHRASVCGHIRYLLPAFASVYAVVLLQVSINNIAATLKWCKYLNMSVCVLLVTFLTFAQGSANC